MKKIFLIFILSPYILTSQEVIPLEKIDFYMGIFTKVKEYEKFSRFKKQKDHDKFTDLFYDENSKVVNDISPSEDFGFLIDNVKYSDNVYKLDRNYLSVDIDILEIIDERIISDQMGEIDLYLTIRRKMAFKDESSNIKADIDDGADSLLIELIDWEQETDVIMTLKYKKYREPSGIYIEEGVDFYISQVKKAKDIKAERIYVPYIKKRFFKEKIILPSNKDFKLEGDQFFNSLKINDNRIILSGDDKKIKYLKQITPLTKTDNILIVGKESDFKLRKNKGIQNYEKSKLKYKLIFVERLPILMHTSISLNTSYSLINSNNSLSIGSYSYKEVPDSALGALRGSNFSANIYLTKLPWLSDRRLERSIFGLDINSAVRSYVGVSIQNRNSNLKINDAEFLSVDYNATDIDGHSYERTHDIKDINETIKFSRIIAGPSLRLDVSFQGNNRKGGYYEGSLGVFGNLFFGLSNVIQSSMTATANYTGHYEDLYNLVIGDDEQFDRYDLGTYNLSKTNENLNLEDKGLDLELGVTGDIPLGLFGIPLKIFNNTNLNIGLSASFNKTWSPNSSLTEVSTTSGELNSLLNLVDEFSITNNTRLNIGLITKF